MTDEELIDRLRKACGYMIGEGDAKAVLAVVTPVLRRRVLIGEARRVLHGQAEKLRAFMEAKPIGSEERARISRRASEWYDAARRMEERAEFDSDPDAATPEPTQEVTPTRNHCHCGNHISECVCDGPCPGCPKCPPSPTREP